MFSFNFQDSQNSKVLIDKLLNRLSDLPTSDCRPAVVVTGLKRSGTELHDFKTTCNRNDQENSSPKYQSLSGGGANAANSTAHVTSGRAQTATSLDEKLNGRVGSGGGSGSSNRRTRSSDNIAREGCKKNANVDGDKAAAVVTSPVARCEKRKIG